MSDPENLKELVDAEIFVEGPLSAADEGRLRRTIEGIPGIADLIITQGRVDVRYDPISITKAKMTERIMSAGFRITEMQSAPASPVINIDVPG